MTKISIVSSDPLLCQELRSQIGKSVPECQVMEVAGSIADARPLLAALPPDALLLDATLPDGTGFDLLDLLPKAFCQVVIMADKPELAYKAFAYNATDFLLKPINEDELGRALGKLKRNEPSNQIAHHLQMLLRGTQHKQVDRLILHLSEGIHILPLNETIRLESDGCYTSFFTANGERIVVTRAIGEFEHLTESGPFFRVHQSHIVNLNFVRKVLKEDGGFVVLDSGVKVPIARRRKEEFFQCVVRHSAA